ncbi:MAG: sarcosine oxidase subunit gamma [Gammaproteobacteria bacterium]|nr:sarcosine oxidase subunit gamma [Gammaproteobacteria bacterium]
MPDLFQQESPLVQMKFVEPEGAEPRIEEVPFLGFINLRGKSTHMAFVAAVLKVLGCEPPTEANTMRESGDYRIYWLGPDEWLVITPTGQAGRVQSQLQAELDGVFSSVVDNSSGLTLLNITGENAAKLLARDCPLDLHPRVFKPGQCAQTRLAKAGMTIAPLRDENGFEIIIRRSFADYIGLWLQDALVELK